MKKSLTLLLSFFVYLPLVFSQTFRDDFEGYTLDYVGPQSKEWTTWSNADGTSEDAYVVDDKAYSGTQSLYFYSAKGGGPQDVVLPFGYHSTGKFKFTTMMYIPSGSEAYFNFQGGSTVGVSWAFEFYMYGKGNFNVGPLSGTYPQDQWFQIKWEIDFDKNNWELFFDDVSMGAFQNKINSVGFIDIFPANPSSEYWMDDITYCVNSDCNPDVSIDKITINPNPVCSNHNADVTLTMTNNGPGDLKKVDIELLVPGQSNIKKTVNFTLFKSGQTTVVNLQGLFKSNVSGKNIKVSAVNMSKDPNPLNDTARIIININPSPSGSTILKASPFQGVLRAGIAGQPDLVEVGKTNTYEFTAPKGYTNFDFNSTWIISAYASTLKGTTVPSTAYKITNPNTTSGANGTISFMGLTKYLDSTIIFSVTLQNKISACDSAVTRVIRVVPTPKTNFSFTAPTCDGIPVVFKNLTTIHSGDVIYKWYFGDSDTADVENPIHLYPTSGTYCVKLTSTSLAYNISHDTTICLVVSEIPKIGFKVTNACEGESLSFLNQSTIGTGTISYDWNFGDGTAHSTLANPTHLYAKAGGYHVTLRATSNTNCASTLTKNSIQFLRPKADFSVQGNCSKNIIEYTNLTTIGAGDMFGDNWDFGDGEGNNERNPTHKYATEGKKTIKYVASSQFGCKDSAIKDITILAAPDASFTNGPVCSMEPVIFNNTTKEPSGVLVSYSWDFGDGATSSNKNPQHHYADLGRVTVKLNANGNNGCNTSFSKEINVLLQPLANFAAADACAGSDVVFVNNSIDDGVVTYKWKFGDGDSSTDVSPVKKYKATTTTTYNVTLTASTLRGCTNTITLPVNIKEEPKCGFTIASAGTGGLEYTFTPAVTTYSFYQWSFESGGSSNATIAKHAFSTDGKYRIKVFMKTVDGCACLDTTQFVNVQHLGVKPLETNSGITFFPNPNNGVFNIQISTIAPSEPFTLNILDLTGRVVNTVNLLGNINHSVVCSELSNGLYTVEIVKKSGERISTKMNIIK